MPGAVETLSQTVDCDSDVGSGTDTASPGLCGDVKKAKGAWKAKDAAASSTGPGKYVDCNYTPHVYQNCNHLPKPHTRSFKGTSIVSFSVSIV